MTLAEIWRVIAGNPGWLAVVVIIITSLIEIAPIKVNPWSKIAENLTQSHRMRGTA